MADSPVHSPHSELHEILVGLNERLPAGPWFYEANIPDGGDRTGSVWARYGESLDLVMSKPNVATALRLVELRNALPEILGLFEQIQTLQAAVDEGWEWKGEAGRLKEQLEARDKQLIEIAEKGYERVLQGEYERLLEQKESADRVLAVADQLAEWCRVTTSVEGVFSNNLGAQAQGQGMANLVVRYVAARESYPASEPRDTGITLDFARGEVRYQESRPE